jgi:D-sedoheptulose 7-phosphate isomerase
MNKKKNKKVAEYLNSLKLSIDSIHYDQIKFVSALFNKIKKNKKIIYICGNGGSAANADHISNDLMLGLNKKKQGYKIVSLSSNIAKITCIGNDLGYEHIYSHQLSEIATKGDLLICLSGSGNSPNIINALKVAKKKNIFSVCILGYSGGAALKLADYPIYFKIDDMQISEDMQMIFFNSVMKFLSQSF